MDRATKILLGLRQGPPDLEKIDIADDDKINVARRAGRTGRHGTEHEGRLDPVRCGAESLPEPLGEAEGLHAQGPQLGIKWVRRVDREQPLVSGSPVVDDTGSAKRLHDFLGAASAAASGPDQIRQAVTSLWMQEKRFKDALHPSRHQKVQRAHEHRRTISGYEHT
jgi:hypothetical protein